MMVAKTEKRAKASSRLVLRWVGGGLGACRSAKIHMPPTRLPPKGREFGATAQGLKEAYDVFAEQEVAAKFIASNLKKMLGNRAEHKGNGKPDGRGTTKAYFQGIRLKQS
jgi:hypothetical protein